MLTATEKTVSIEISKKPMKLQDLKNWHKLTPKEQARLKEIYGENPPITKTMAEPAPKGPYYKTDHGIKEK